MATNPLNVQQLGAFFKENSTVPLEQLKESAVHSGYSQEDVDEAVKSLPNLQSTVVDSTGGESTVSQKPQETVQKPVSRQTKIILLSLGGLALLGTLGATMFAFRGKSGADSTTRTTAKASVEPVLPTKGATPSARVSPSIAAISPSVVQNNNPLSGFASFLTAGNYRINTSGKLSVAEAGATASGTLTLNLDNASFYLKRGELVRSDLVESGNQQSLVLVNNNLYFLDHASKSMAQLNATGKPPSESALYPLFRYSLPVMGLIDAQVQGTLIWQKNSDIEWQTEWVYPLFSRGGTKPFAVKITLNSTGRLITTFSLKNDATAAWQDVTLAYVKMDSLDAETTLPKDYKVASLSGVLTAPTVTTIPTATPKP